MDEVWELIIGASYAQKHIYLDNNKPEVIAKDVRNEVFIIQKVRHLHIPTVLFYFKNEIAYSIFMLPVADYNFCKFLSLCIQEDYSSALTK